MSEAQCLGFLNTPPIWENKQFDIQQFEFPSLSLHSFRAKSIPTNIRLGHQMEHVYKQLVEHSDNYNVVLHNLPIRKEKVTIGEIDFIIKDSINNKFIHVELTYKFYIIDPEISTPIDRLIGPNRRDSFVAKMEKMKNVQFPLLHSEEGAKTLKDKNIDGFTIKHQCCFKAQLFYPYGSKDIDIGPLNANCLVGYWLRFDDFNIPHFAIAQYYIPSKSEWVIEPNDQVDWKSHVEILEDIKQSLLKEKSPMVWLKNADNKFEKIFVVWW